MDKDSTAAAAAAAAHPLRLLAIASFVPSFALCIAHGVLSHQPVPAVGLVPQSVSTVTAILLLRVASAAAAGRGADAEADTESVSDATHNADSIRARLTHPIAVFVLDLVLAASLMVVLVFTWIDHSDNASLSMLAAYATIPILTSFFAHLFAALHAVYQGLAIHGVVQWLAWRAVPPDCPNCNHRLRPSSLPELPWFKNFQWRRSYAPLLVAADDDDDADRYRDDPEDGYDEDDEDEGPETVEVRSKRSRKSKPTPGPSDSEPDLPWSSAARVY